MNGRPLDKVQGSEFSAMIRGKCGPRLRTSRSSDVTSSQPSRSARATYRQSYRPVPEFDEMAKKTCLRKLCKYLPMSVAAQTACALAEQEEAGIPQQFTPEVPLELQPTWVEPQSEPAAEEMPKAEELHK